MTYLGQPFASPEEALAHYGTKGMKWGVRKKPDSSTKVGGSSEEAVLIAVGALYAAAVLAAIGSQLKDSGRIHKTRTIFTTLKKDPTLAHKMSVDALQSKVIKPINLGYGAKGTKMNCRRCTFAYEMRRRGYDVKSTKSVHATGQSTRGLSIATKGSSKGGLWGKTQISSSTKMSAATPEGKSKAIFDALAKNPNGARGELGMAWKMGGGHSMAWEIVNNKPVIFDTQNLKTYRSRQAFSSFTPVVSDAAFTRLDNVPLNEAFLRKWVQNV